MNLLYTLTAYPPAIGGAQLHQHLLAQQLQQDHDIQVVSFWDRNRTDWLLGTTVRSHSTPHPYTIDAIPVHRMGFSGIEKLKMLPWLPLYYPAMAMALPPLAKRIAPQIEPFAATADLIHNVRIGREVITQASLDLARSHDIPFILTPVHHPRWVGWRYREFNRLYRSADAIITLTPSEKRVLIELGVQEERIYVTGHAPILAEQANPEILRQRVSPQGLIVLFLGQFHTYKGYRQLLEAAPLVWDVLPDTQFVFIGPPIQQSERIFKSYPDPRIHRLGAVSLQDKTNALAACDVLCVPSSQESFGGVYTEAWSFGKPVIGCRIPAVADVITDGVDGYLVDPVPKQIADRLIYILSHADKAQALGQAGQAKVADRYTWPKLADKTNRIYAKVCSGR